MSPLRNAARLRATYATSPARNESPAPTKSITPPSMNFAALFVGALAYHYAGCVSRRLHHSPSHPRILFVVPRSHISQLRHREKLESPYTHTPTHPREQSTCCESTLIRPKK